MKAARFRGMDRFDVADAEIIIIGYDDRVEFKGKEIVISNLFDCGSINISLQVRRGFAA